MQRGDSLVPSPRVAKGRALPVVVHNPGKPLELEINMHIVVDTLMFTGGQCIT